MSDATLPLRTLAFGDLDGAAWGVAWFPDPGLPGFVALGSAQDAVTVEAHLEPDDESGGWRLHGYGVELNVSAAGEDARRPARRVRCGLPGARRDHRRGG